MTLSNNSTVSAWVLFIGIMLVLIGIYASARTVVNVAAFEKYPASGVLSMNVFGQPPYLQREEDCTYPQTYFSPDGKARLATSDEKKQEKMVQDNCIRGVKDARANAKVNDMSQSMLFLVLGIGLIASRKFFFKA